MIDLHVKMTRRKFIITVGAVSAGIALKPPLLPGEARRPIERAIPSSGERLPVIGMGTWGTFDVGDDPAAREQLSEVMQAFFDHGGTVIDSSPMYGRAEAVVGSLLKTVRKKGLFAATKVWTDGKEAGIAQMRQSMQYFGVPVMDLMQIHNLRDWPSHLPTLKEWKREGRIRYLGITTSHGRFHEELERIMRAEPLDFIQLTYNIEDRIAEDRLLPLAADRGIATLINRPFRRGDMFDKTRGKPLPEWSADFDCSSWGQFFLKFVVSHPAVTCVIPATSKAHHMVDNMAAGFGRLPDEKLRRRMIEHYAAL